MKIAIDSNRYTDLARGIPEVVELIENAEVVYIPLIVVAELRAGFAYGTKKDRNEKILTQFLNADRVFVLNPDEQTAFFYADIYASLRKKGKPIPTNDIWIAALCIQHGLVLYDRDQDFDSVPQLARIYTQLTHLD